MPSARTLIDHDEIRQWAEARDAQPACVRGTGGKDDPGMIRLDFPGFSGKESLSPISWDQWFKSFDENGLALLVQEKTARGEASNFNKLVSRESGNRKRQQGGRKAATRGKRASASSRSRRARATSAGSRSTKGAAKPSRRRSTRAATARPKQASRAGGSRARR